MATRKKPKHKAKPKRRKAPHKRPAVHRKTVKVARKPARKVPVRRTPPKAARPATPPPPPEPGERIGVVTHYYGHVSVAVVKLEAGTLRVGDTIHIRGHTSDFTQRVESLQIEHAPVAEVGMNDDFGLKVSEHVREHDVVYKVK
jgi:putative protease